jgi:hypothetical protein
MDFASEWTSLSHQPSFRRDIQVTPERWIARDADEHSFARDAPHARCAKTRLSPDDRRRLALLLLHVLIQAARHCALYLALIAGVA